MLERVCLGETSGSGGSNTPRYVRNNILDFQRAMSVRIAMENGKI